MLWTRDLLSNTAVAKSIYLGAKLKRENRSKLSVLVREPQVAR